MSLVDGTTESDNTSLLWARVRILVSTTGQNTRMDTVLSCLEVGSSLVGESNTHADCILQVAHRTGWKSRGRE